MRRWQTVLVLSMASSFCLPTIGAGRASAQDLAVIADGVITNATGRPLVGDVELLAWPTGKDIGIGQTAPLVSVSRGRARQDGRFALASEATPELADLAGRNGGYVNFELRTMAGGAIQEVEFSRYLAEGAITAQSTGASKRTTWRADQEKADVEPLHITIDRPASSPDAIRPMQGGCYGMTLVDSQIGQTVIGELRTPGDTQAASFSYGKRADSEIGVAARGTDGAWSLSGTFHIANSQSAAIIQRANSGEQLLVRSRFLYDRYEYFCPSGRREKVVPREWFGDVQSEPTAVLGCANTPEIQRGHYSSNSDFDRDSQKATRWQGAVQVFGASLTAQSGYSQFVKSHWSFGSQHDHLLCGDNGPPARASRIFAGPSA